MKNMTDIKKLTKMIEDQAKQIDSLKKAITIMQRRFIVTAKKADRTYHMARKSSNDIMSLTDTLRRNK